MLGIIHFTLSLICAQRFSVGHFWSPHHTITEGIFCKLFINTTTSISYKHWVSISSKSLIITQLAQCRPQNTSITRLQLRVPNKMQALENRTLAFFFFPFAPRLHHWIGYLGQNRYFSKIEEVYNYNLNCNHTLIFKIN